MSDRGAIGAEVDRITAGSPEPFTPDTIANVREFLKLVRGRCPLPEVGKGYYGTVRVEWEAAPGGPLQIEIFGDRLEVYRFHDKRTDIWEEPHVCGEPFSPAFLAELPWLPHEP